jgi:predicted nucleic acid-binding protein
VIKYFLDSSALMKLFVQEVGSAQVFDLMAHALPGQVHVSALAFVEVRSAIRRRQAVKDIDHAAAEEAIANLEAERKGIPQQAVTENIHLLAQVLVDQHLLRSLDSVQLASAIVVAQDLHRGFHFVCSDHRLSSAARAEGLPVLDPAIA